MTQRPDTGPFDTVDPSDRELADASAAFDAEEPLASVPNDDVDRFLAGAEALRARVRAAPTAAAPPELVAGVLHEIEEVTRPTTNHRWRAIAAVAASFLIGVAVAAVMLLDDDFDSELVAAAEFEMETRGSLNAVVEFDASLRLVERGAHPDLPERRYEGRLRYRSPEVSSLALEEVTVLPSGWPSNDVELVVAEDRAWRSRRLACPVESMPSCLGEPSIDGIDGRAPFSSGWAAPLELVIPVESVRGASVARTADAAFTALTTVDRAAPLLATTIDNGAFRQVHADDQVEIWLDARDRTLLGFAIRAADTPARAVWAATWGYQDEPGDELFRLEVDVGGEATLPPEGLIDDVATGGLSAGGFVDGHVATGEIDAAIPDGFALHRTGTLSVAGAPATTIASWVDGRAWITIRTQAAEVRAAPGFVAVERDGRVVLVDEAARVVMILTPDARIVVEGTVTLDRLIDLAFELPFAGDHPTEAATSTSSTIRVERTIVSVELRAGRLLPPADRGDVVGVTVRGTVGRFSPTAGELTWVESGLVIALSGTSDLVVLLAAAEEVALP